MTPYIHNKAYPFAKSQKIHFYVTFLRISTVNLIRYFEPFLLCIHLMGQILYNIIFSVQRNHCNARIIFGIKRTQLWYNKRHVMLGHFHVVIGICWGYIALRISESIFQVCSLVKCNITVISLLLRKYTRTFDLASQKSLRCKIFPSISGVRKLYISEIPGNLRINILVYFLRSNEIMNNIVVYIGYMTIGLSNLFAFHMQLKKNNTP